MRHSNRLYPHVGAAAVHNNKDQQTLSDVSVLLAEHTLSAPHVRKSLKEHWKALRNPQVDAPILTCLPPLDASSLVKSTVASPTASRLQNEMLSFAHVLISMESFFASLSLLEELHELTEHCSSMPALFCSAILQPDTYRTPQDMEIARLIMEHIDTHHSVLSHEVNIELGSTYIDDPLPERSDNKCRCPLQRLDLRNVSRFHPSALVKTALISLNEIEDFNTAHGLVDPLIAAKYFHAFELWITQLMRPTTDIITTYVPGQHNHLPFVLPRVRQSRSTGTIRVRSML